MAKTYKQNTTSRLNNRGESSRFGAEEGTRDFDQTNPAYHKQISKCFQIAGDAKTYQLGQVKRHR